MTPDAQFALRRGEICAVSLAARSTSLYFSIRSSHVPVIEKYVKNTRFCLICNYVSRIIPALQSRCTRFRFAPLTRPAMESRLRYIIEKEGLSTRISDDAVKAVLVLANGDMRKVLNVLQAAASGYDAVDEDSIYAVTGNPRPAEVKEAIHQLMTGEYMVIYKRACGTSGFFVCERGLPSCSQLCARCHCTLQTFKACLRLATR
jgi:hypothetical protein